MGNKSKIWYSFIGGNFDDYSKGFYDNKDFEWIKFLESNTTVIKDEIDQYIADNEDDIKPYFNKDLVTKQKSWKTSAFFFWKWALKKNMKKCPKTMEVLKQIPNIVSASISILEPGVTIKPHMGDTNAIVRCHLGLEIPEGLPECGFESFGEKRAWREGEVLAFNDSARHTAWNLSNKRRVVLLIDVIRPEYIHKKYTVCSKVLGALLMQGLSQKFSFFKIIPRTLRLILIRCFAIVLNIILRLRKFI